MIKKVYIVHQYLDKSHFKALYEHGNKYGYHIEDYYLLKNIIKKEIFRKKLGLRIKEGLNYLFKQNKIFELENEIIIVGLAPYDPLLKKYRKVFQKNRCIYFSSWQTWDGTDFPRGNLKYRKVWEDILTNDFSGAACVSKKTRDGISEYILNAAVVNHAISEGEYRKKTEKVQNHRYLFFGRFEDNKNIDWMLKWLKSEDSFDCEFDFAGFGSYQSKIESLAKIDDRVHYLGLLDKSKLKETLCEYEFVIMPSKIEPFGISLIEALASGTPCVTSDALGPSEIITDGYNGIICDHNDYSSFVVAMDRVKNMALDDYQLLCGNAVTSGHNYSTEYIAKKWCDLLDSIK